MRRRSLLLACVSGAVCLLCGVAAPYLLWRLVDVGDFVRAYLTFVLMALSGCVGAGALDAFATALRYGLVRAGKGAARVVFALLHGAVRVVCACYQGVMLIMVAGESLHATYPLWARMSALALLGAVIAGYFLLFRLERTLKAESW